MSETSVVLVLFFLLGIYYMGFYFEKAIKLYTSNSLLLYMQIILQEIKNKGEFSIFRVKGLIGTCISLLCYYNELSWTGYFIKKRGLFS
jgi:hypothetical protein